LPLFFGAAKSYIANTSLLNRDLIRRALSGGSQRRAFWFNLGGNNFKLVLVRR
jgi:hypothetical protein